MTYDQAKAECLEHLHPWMLVDDGMVTITSLMTELGIPWHEYVRQHLQEAIWSQQMFQRLGGIE